MNEKYNYDDDHNDSQEEQVVSEESDNDSDINSNDRSMINLSKPLAKDDDI